VDHECFEDSREDYAGETKDVSQYIVVVLDALDMAKVGLGCVSAVEGERVMGRF